MQFRKPTLPPSSDKEAPNLVNPSDRTILSHWAPLKDETIKPYIKQITFSF